MKFRDQVTIAQASNRQTYSIQLSQKDKLQKKNSQPNIFNTAQNV